MLKAKVESAGRSGANGSAIVNLTFDVPSGVTDLTGEIRNAHGLFGSRSRLIEAATSAAVSGEPSENFTPGRSVNTATRPPGPWATRSPLLQRPRRPGPLRRPRRTRRPAPDLSSSRSPPRSTGHLVL